MSKRERRAALYERNHVFLGVDHERSERKTAGVRLARESLLFRNGY
jgi:hypothetical protein